MDDFVNFIKKQGVVGVAVAFVVGAAAVAMIERIVEALVTPLIAVVAGEADITNAFAVTVGDTTLKFGMAIDAIIQFLIIAFVVYTMVRAIGADKWDSEK